MKAVTNFAGSSSGAAQPGQATGSRASILARTCTYLLGGLMIGCSSHTKVSSPAAFDVDFRAESDTGADLEGVSVSSSHRLLGTTNGSGRVSLRTKGLEGEIINVDLTCPDGYLAPELPISIRLAHTQSVDVRAAQPLKLSAVCTRTVRDVAIVVHADQGGSIPVTVDGQRATTMNADGYAQLLLHVDRAVRSITVGLDTSGQLQLKPKNPRREYELPPGDSILVYDQKFVKQRPTFERATAKREMRHIPYRID